MRKVITGVKQHKAAAPSKEQNQELAHLLDNAIYWIAFANYPLKTLQTSLKSLKPTKRYTFLETLELLKKLRAQL